MVPFSLTLTNTFLCHYEKKWLDNCPIKLYKRYVDDIFVMFRSRDHVKKFVDYMNTKHLNIRFTFEIEDQNSLLFLDTNILRNTKKKAFEASVYRKSPFSSALINFKSFVPMKKNLWRTTKKLSRRDLLLLTCLVYTNISVASSFSLFCFRFFLYIFVLVLTIIKLQRENFMENFGWLQNITSKNETKFSDCSGKYGHVESAD